MAIRKGSIVTVKKAEQTYGYGDQFLLPGETCTVVNPKTPTVRGSRPYFAYCEFVKDGKHEGVGIFPDNIVVVVR